MKIGKKRILFFLTFLIVLFVAGLALGSIYRTTREIDKADDIVEQKIFEARIDQLTDLGIISPWANQNPDNKEILPPTIEQLHNIYLKIRESYSNRDIELFSNYSSLQRTWMLNNNTGIYEGNYKGVDVYSKQDISPEELFINIEAIVGGSFNAPRVFLLEPSSITMSILTEEEILNNEQPKPILVDFNKGTKVALNESSWSNGCILNYEIEGNAYQYGTGQVAFVNYNGEWKYQGELWESKFSEQTIKDVPNEEIGSVVKIDVQNKDSLDKTQNIRTGDKIEWNNMKGIIYSVIPSDSYWNSLLINYGSEYVKQFNKPGHYTYVINDTYKEIYKGEIYVHD